MRICMCMCICVAQCSLCTYVMEFSISLSVHISGNAGFETAQNLVGAAAYIHMMSRSRVRQAYQTHYVGDLRAINNQLVDTYQLKSLDGFIGTV